MTLCTEYLCWSLSCRLCHCAMCALRCEQVHTLIAWVAYLATIWKNAMMRRKYTP